MRNSILLLAGLVIGGGRADYLTRSNWRSTGNERRRLLVDFRSASSLQVNQQQQQQQQLKERAKNSDSC